MTNIKEMRHDILEWAISLNNILDHIIMNYFDMYFFEKEYGMMSTRRMEMFSEYLLRDLRSSSKINLIIEINKEIEGNLYKKFSKDMETFSKIRNKFAHSLYPTKPGKFMPDLFKNMIRIEQREWKAMYLKAENLFTKIVIALNDEFINNVNFNTLARKYTLDLINHYEKLIKKERSNKNNLKS